MNRFNPFKLADHLIETQYRIPIRPDLLGVSSNEPFMTARNDLSINLGEYLDFMRKYIVALQSDLKLYSKYHEAAFKIKDTGPRSEWQEGCRDTFGAGFFTTHDEYKSFREIYWEIQKLKEERENED